MYPAEGKSRIAAVFSKLGAQTGNLAPPEFTGTAPTAYSNRTIEGPEMALYVNEGSRLSSAALDNPPLVVTRFFGGSQKRRQVHPVLPHG
jgi:hypothetical protein